VRASTRAPVIEMAPASQHRPDPLVPALDLMAAWSFCLFFLLLCQLGMNHNPSMPVFFHRTCADGQASPRFLLLAIFSFFLL
jgi:hypothetical protein